MIKELRWRVIYGYSPDDYISIGEEFLEKAKYAMISGKNFAHKNTIIRGSEIKRIEDDYRFYTGWNNSFHPSTAEDQIQLERDVPTKELRERGVLADSRVAYIARTGKTNLLSNIQEADKLLLA
jgi:hypothetical protein